MKPTVTIDDERTRQLLRAMGEAALALADEKTLDNGWPHVTAAEAAELAMTTSQLLTVPEACERLRISRWSFYRLVQQNQLRSVMIGRRRLIPQLEISRFLAGLSGTGESA